MKGYIGKIMNRGSQRVEAPHKSKSGKSGKVITGGDLRARKSKKSGK